MQNLLEIADDLHGKSLLLAVSGGLDSVCLLDFFAKNQAKLGVKLAIAHIDHGIRGKVSAEDALFVKNLAKKYGLPFYFECLGSSLQNVSNVEGRAREKRYEILQKFKNRGNFDYIVTAHHGDDLAETLFMRLSRGTSLIGLAGIKKFREDGVYRPLLSLFRKDFEEYACKNNLTFREDSTNKDNNYRRNEIRNTILPILERESKGFKSSLCKISQIAAKIRQKIIEKAKTIFSPLEIPKEKWPFPYVFSPYAHVMALNFNAILDFILKYGAGGEEIFRLWLNYKGFDLHLGKQGLSLFPMRTGHLELGSVYFEKSLSNLWIVDLRSKKQTDILYLCKAQTLGSAVWRYRKDGDTYSPNHMRYKNRKLSKWMQECAIPLFARDSLPLLAEGSNILRIAKSSDFE